MCWFAYRTFTSVCLAIFSGFANYHGQFRIYTSTLFHSVGQSCSDIVLSIDEDVGLDCELVESLNEGTRKQIQKREGKEWTQTEYEVLRLSQALSLGHRYFGGT
jgi:hypothetical protein